MRGPRWGRGASAGRIPPSGRRWRPPRPRCAAGRTLERSWSSRSQSGRRRLSPELRQSSRRGLARWLMGRGKRNRQKPRALKDSAFAGRRGQLPARPAIARPHPTPHRPSARARASRPVTRVSVCHRLSAPQRGYAIKAPTWCLQHGGGHCRWWGAPAGCFAGWRRRIRRGRMGGDGDERAGRAACRDRRRLIARASRRAHGPAGAGGVPEQRGRLTRFAAQATPKRSGHRRAFSRWASASTDS